MDCDHEVVQRGEVFVVSRQPTQQFPNAFNRIEVRAVRRQEIQSVRRGTRIGRMMVGGVVEHQDRKESASAMARELAQEHFEGVRIENRAEHGEQLAGTEIDGSK